LLVSFKLFFVIHGCLPYFRIYQLYAYYIVRLRCGELIGYGLCSSLFYQNSVANRALIDMHISRYRSAISFSGDIVAIFLKSRYRSTQFLTNKQSQSTSLLCNAHTAAGSHGVAEGRLIYNSQLAACTRRTTRVVCHACDLGPAVAMREYSAAWRRRHTPLMSDGKSVSVSRSRHH